MPRVRAANPLCVTGRKPILQETRIRANGAINLLELLACHPLRRQPDRPKDGLSLRHFDTVIGLGSGNLAPPRALTGRFAAPHPWQAPKGP